MSIHGVNTNQGKRIGEMRLLFTIWILARRWSEEAERKHGGIFETRECVVRKVCFYVVTLRYRTTSAPFGQKLRFCPIALPARFACALYGAVGHFASTHVVR